MKITDAPVKFNAGPKIPTAADASKHKVNSIQVLYIRWNPYLYNPLISFPPCIMMIFFLPHVDAIPLRLVAAM